MHTSNSKNNINKVFTFLPGSHDYGTRCGHFQAKVQLKDGSQV